MEVRPGFKQAGAKVIPVDWASTPLANFSAFITKGSTPTTFGFKWQRSGVLFLRSECVSEDGLDLAQSMFISASAHNALRRSEVAYGDILITITGNVGRVVRFVGGEEANINQHIARVRVNASNVDAAFVFHCLSQPAYRSHFGSITTGQAYPQISLQQVRGAEVQLPPLAEQRAIATVLSDADALLAKLDALIAKKRDLKQATMQQLLTGQTRLPGFSGEWETKPLGELFAFSGGHTASREQLSGTGHCYLHYGDIHLSKKTFIDLDAEYLEIPKLAVELSKVNKASLLKDGDIVFVDASEDDEGTSKHIVVVNPDGRPYISGLHTIVAKSKNDRIDNLFKRYCFQTRSIKEQFRFFAVGTKVSGISKTSVAKVELSFPPSTYEQSAIATVLADMDAELNVLEGRRVKTLALKQGMMQELLTGKIRLV